MLKARLTTAAVGIPILIAVTWAGGYWFAVVAALVVMAAAAEYLRASDIRLLSPEGLVALFWTGAIVAVAEEGGLWRERFLLLALLTIFVVIILEGQWLLKRETLEKLESSWAAIAKEILYLGWLGSYLVFVRNLEDGRDWFLTVLFVTWTADTAAYAIGRLWGKRPFAPIISPKKTWEGTLAAPLGALIAMVFCKAVFDLPRLGWGEAIGLGLGLGVAAVLGDLFESLLKRGLHIKDASAILPGHGGFLDRLDSVLLVGAVLYFATTWVLA